MKLSNRAVAPFVTLLSIFCAQSVLAQDTTAVNPAERSNTQVIINRDKTQAEAAKKNTADSLAKAQASTTAGTGGDSIGGQTPSHRTDLQRRRVAYNFTTLGFGPAAMKNMGTDELAYSFFAGRLWEVNPYAAVKANFEVTSDFSHAVAGVLDLGANYYLLNADVTPYIGGDLGFGLGRDGAGKTPFGFDLGGALGVVLFRTSTVQMSVEGKAQVLFDTHNNSYPDIYTVRLGVMF
jgi:hypothetical protein